MKSNTSISGGRTSAYLAANYPFDEAVFALVRTDDPNCLFKDRKLAALVEDRIQAPFVGTLEDDLIIYTMFDLEQFLGRRINWVTGPTFDHYVDKINGGYPPNRTKRGCTTFLKIAPMASWWYTTHGEPVEQNIGFRAEELSRANNLLSKLNSRGFIEAKVNVGHKKTKRGWIKINKVVDWQVPRFRLIEDGVLKRDIVQFWKGKKVRFAEYNNCVGCFNRSLIFLAKMYDEHENKMDWFASKEAGGKFWKPGARYTELKNSRISKQLSFDDLPGCDSGYCGL